ncbi:hypothetical protein ACF0H5_009191 [Mactra antiquata]
MDVTYGLLSNLVKTRAIQRVLAPIASQISLLIILNESDNGSQFQHGEMVPCAKMVMQASHRLVTVAKQQALTTSDEEFKALTVSACEVLELSSSNLYIASERLEASNSSKEARNKMVQASKDVLQGTMKVLLVADDAEIRRLIRASHIVTEKLAALDTCSDMSQLVHRFKEFTDALAVMTGLTDRRQRDLIHSKQRERIITSLNILRKSISSLSVAMQNSVKYGHNPQAQVGKSYILNEIQTALSNIIDAVQNIDTDEENIDLEQPGQFVTSIDMALETLAEDVRFELNTDIEMWTEEAVRHSMIVAHLCHDSNRDSIIQTCQQVIQTKGNVMSLYKMLQSSTDDDICKLREDYNEACEHLTDYFCDLEKIVNISLLHFVVEYFKETTEPLERLVKKALQKGTPIEPDDCTIRQYEDHGEKICQIASLAAASSTDARRVHDIRHSVLRLEHLDPEIVPTVISISKISHDKSTMRHLKLLMKEWNFELKNVVRLLDEMTDPKMFMLVSERKIEDDINTCNGCILIQDENGFNIMLQSVIGRSRRVVQVAETIVDSHEDPLYRNGLMVFIIKLKKVIAGVQTAGDNVKIDLSDKHFQDLLRKRFTQLQDSLIKLKSGLNDSNHPHVLSPLRRNVRSSKVFDEKKSVVISSVPKSSRLQQQQQYCHGDNIIAATSVPRLNLESIIHDDHVTPKNSVNLHSDIVRSKSASQVQSACPQTLSLKLWSDLLSWATKGDREKVNQLSGDLLSWTNHILDVTHTVLKYTEDPKKKREMRDVCVSVDQMTSELLDNIKLVLHGDFSQLNILKAQGNEWGSKVEKIKAYVDVTVEQWKHICDKTVDAARLFKKDSVKQQVNIMECHLECLSEVVTVTERLRWESLVTSQDNIETLLEDKKEIENLTVTFKTTVDMVTEHGMIDEISQLQQLGREWSVKIYSMVSILDSLCMELLDNGVERRIWSGLSIIDGLHETLQKENTKMKDLMKSSCYSDEVKIEQYKNYVGDMIECMEEIKTLTLMKNNDTLSMVRKHYKLIHIGLYRGMWIIKAIQCIDMSRQQTSIYCSTLDIMVEKAFIVKSSSGTEKEENEVEFDEMLEQFTNKVMVIRKKVLQVIQLSSELGNRSIVRQCMDTVNQLATQVVVVVKQLTDTNSSGNHGNILWHRLLWCAKVHHLITCLSQMSDIKQSSVDDIKSLLKSNDVCIDYDVILQKLTNLEGSESDDIGTKTSSYRPVSVQVTSALQSQQVKGDSTVPPVTMKLGSRKLPLSSQTSPTNIQHTLVSSIHPHSINFSKVPVGNFLDVDNFDPVTVDFKAIEERMITKTESMYLSSESSEVKTDDNDENVWTTIKTTTTSPPSAKPVLELLKNAQYIQKQSDKWEDNSNPIVKVAKTMTTQIQQMTDYIRQQGPIQNHLTLVETAKAVAENSDKVLQFAQILVKHCVDKSFSIDLQSYCLQVPLVRQQLLILSNVQLGTAQSDTADRILVQNAQNLMRKILQMISACETVCMKGLSESILEESRPSIMLATQWKQRYISHRQHGVTSSNCDELGLRIIEGDRPPPALTQIFQT